MESGPVSQKMTDIGPWHPLQGSHAIQLCAISMIYGEAVGDVTWRKAVQDVRPLAKAGGLVEQTFVPPTIPAELVAFGFKAADQAGASFVLVGADGDLQERLSLTREQLRYDDFSYVRWRPFKERAKQMLSSIVDRYANVSSLDTIHSEYVDVFLFSGSDSDQKDISKLVDRESPYIPGAVYKDTDFWHSHAGWFEYPDGLSRYLLNVNVDIRDEKSPNFEGRLVRIHTSVDVQFGRDGMHRPADEAIGWDLVEHHLDASHSRLKALLKSVLTDEAARKVSLL